MINKIRAYCSGLHKGANLYCRERGRLGYVLGYTKYFGRGFEVEVCWIEEHDADIIYLYTLKEARQLRRDFRKYVSIGDIEAAQ